MSDAPGGSGTVDRWVAAAVMGTVVATLVWSGVTIVERRASSTRDAPSVTTSDTGSAVSGADVPAEGRVYESIYSAKDADASTQAWYVLDDRGKRVHRVDLSGRLTHSFGGEGGGPGELSRPEALTVHADTVVVAELMNPTLHMYAPDGTFLTARRVPADDCRTRLIFDVASSVDGLLLLTMCMDEPMRPDARVDLVTAASELRRVATIEMTSRAVDPYFAPVMTPFEGGVLVGLAGDDCLSLVGTDGGASRSVCHRWIERAAPLAKHVESNRALVERGRMVGVEVAQPERLPGFDRVFLDTEGRLVYRAWADVDEETYRAVVEGADGAQRDLGLPGAKRLFVSGAGTLLAWDELEGTRLLLLSQMPG